MKRTDKWPETRTFHYHNENPKNRITGDCTFRAIAQVTGKTWQQVVMEMADMSVRTGYAINDKKGIETYLKEQGFTKCKQPRKYDHTKYTGKEFCKVLQLFGKDPATYGNEIGDGIISAPRIVASIGGHHLTAIINGKVNDIWDCTDKSIGNYWFNCNYWFKA